METPTVQLLIENNKMNSAKAISIALVDDHKILLDGIEALLSQYEDLKVIIKEQSGEALLARDDYHDIDLLVIDINMKGMDGIQVLKELRSNNFTGACIFLTSYDDLKLVNEAMNLGAKGYLTKSTATDCLEEAIKTVASGKRFYSQDIEQRILTAFSKAEKKSDNQEQSVLRMLTQREIEILKLIAQEYTSEDISKQLFIAKSTVDTHRKNLIFKLKVRNSVGLGLFAIRNNLI